jgi:pSer/pThr/pTyr-binding forkhead associated (FHA) protein
MPQPPAPRPSPAPWRGSTLVEPRDGPHDRARPGPPPAGRASTMIESEEPRSSPEPPPTPTAIARRAEPFRPTARPSVAILTALDDGCEDGEVIRLRGDRFVIGRSDGDFLLPHDSRVSSRHVEIARRPGPAPNRWIVTDLKSTNGLFVRVRRALLADGAEFLVGGGRYRFDAPRAANSTTPLVAPTAIARGQTVGWAAVPQESPGSPALIELVGADEGPRIVLSGGEISLGSDASCTIRRPDDPFCEPRHLKLSRTPTGEWVAEHNRTLNGLWLRMERAEVDAVILFQVGEQRFRLKVN